MSEHTIFFRIYWQDLTLAAQQKLLRVFGDNCNWDCIPMAILEVSNDSPDSSNFPGKDIVLDSFLGDEFK